MSHAVVIDAFVVCCTTRANIGRQYEERDAADA